MADLSRYYVKRLRAARHGPWRILAFVVAASLHAASHALVALVGSALALSLAMYGPAGRPINATSAAATANGEFARSTMIAAFVRRLPAYGDARNEAVWLAAAGLVVVLVKGITGAYATYVQVLVAGRVGCGLRLELFDALLGVHRLRHPRHGDHGPAAHTRTAHAIVSMTDRVRDVEAGLGHGLLGSLRALAQLAPLAALLVALSPGMATVGGAVLAGFGWTLGRWRRGFRAATRRAAQEHEDLVAAADESVRHADLWVSYGAERRARASVRTLGAAVARGSARLAGLAAALSASNEALAATALVVALACARAGWLGGAVQGGNLLAFAVTFFLAYRPLRELADARIAFARAQIAFADLVPVLETTPAPQVVPPASEDRRRWPLAELELRDLRVAHGACAATTLRVAPGAIAVVTGPTGIGKTTLLRTLLGLEAPRGGEVLYGGESLAHAPAGPITRPFAWVPQDAPLLDDTLAANIDLGAPGVDAAAMLAPLGARHLVSAFHTDRLGAGGRRASGGERQWIALARALATLQPVLLLDEPTSGLDPDAQAVVLDAIRRLRGERTVILVTHRPEPVAIADVVLAYGPS